MEPHTMSHLCLSTERAQVIERVFCEQSQLVALDRAMQHASIISYHHPTAFTVVEGNSKLRASENGGGDKPIILKVWCDTS